MEMDCKLKTLANVFKFLVYFGEIAENIFKFILPRRNNHFMFSYRYSNSDFTLKKGFTVQRMCMNLNAFLSFLSTLWP